MRSLRTGLSLAAVAGSLTLLFTAPTAHAADTPLRDLAAAKGKVIGTAVTGSKLTGTYGDLAGAQFNSLTPGNAMKWGSVEPTQGSFDWTEADQIVAFAQAHNQQVRGHTLVWHNQNPNWLTNGSWTSAQLGSLLQNHISTEVSRYKGKITAWDVVNEPFNEVRHLPLHHLVQRPRRRLHRQRPDLGRTRPTRPRSSTSTTTTSKASTRRAPPCTTW